MVSPTQVGGKTVAGEGCGHNLIMSDLFEEDG